jgi:hypothetical protein
MQRRKSASTRLRLVKNLRSRWRSTRSGPSVAGQPLPLTATVGDVTTQLVHRGTFFDDTIDGTRNDDIIDGLGGNDVIHGWDGNDHLNGGGDNDEIYGDAGADTLIGDFLTVQGYAGGMDFLDGGDGDDVITGGLGNDTSSAVPAMTILAGIPSISSVTL